ncbi:MAG: FG-GAP-like repeat-containing protein, partial [Phycisphaeraceae bacterium]
MALTRRTAARAAPTICALIGALIVTACSVKSPPHAAPANPAAEPGDGQVELSWNAVTDAQKYVILWSDVADGDLSNVINDIAATNFLHTGLTNLRLHRYRIAAVTSGGRGPESNMVSAEPGPVPGDVEWAAVTSNKPISDPVDPENPNPGHTIHFATAVGATHYRVFIASAEEALKGRRPATLSEDVSASPHQRAAIPIGVPFYYRVIAMNGTRFGAGGPIVVSPTHVVATSDLPRVGAALGDPNADNCLDLVSANGNVTGTACQGAFTARDLAVAGLADLLAAGRTNGDSRFADFTGDRREDLFSNTLSPADDTASRALLHVNQGTGNFQTNAGVTALGIGGFGGTLLAADFDNDNDIDLFAPHDHTRGDGARNWLLSNDGGGVFADVAAAGGVDSNPAGANFVPRGGQAVDFNEDGRVDLLFGSRLLISNGNGTFSDGSAAAGIPVRADQGLKLIDVDLDEDLDLIHHDGAITRLHRNAAG